LIKLNRFETVGDKTIKKKYMEQIQWQCVDNTCTIQNINPTFTPFFTSGDIMISILLLILVVLKLIELLRGAISKVILHRRYQGNNSPDGKEFYEI